jgi:hypothetical protein
VGARGRIVGALNPWHEDTRVGNDRDDRRRPRRPRPDPTADMANLILRRILIFGGIFLGGVFVLFCAVFVIIMIAGGGLAAFVNSNLSKPPPPAASKPATTLKK